MSKMAKACRGWRLDPAVVSGTGRRRTEGRSGCLEFAAVVAGGRERWRRLVRWAWGRLGGVGVGSATAAGESVVHDFARALEDTEDPAEIESLLVRFAQRLTGAAAVDLAAGEGEVDRAAGEGQVSECSRRENGGGVEPNREPEPARAFELELRCGARSRGVLRIDLRGQRQSGSAWLASDLERARLRTLCTLATLALERLEGRDGRLPPGFGGAGGAAPAAELKAADRGLERADRVSPVLVQDATFLQAVLPFAVSQARRHGEPLSILCVAVDRLNGMIELLGRDQADRVIASVGAHIARILRASDIVARIDDDRLIAVLPRAQLHDAYRVAQNICRTIEGNTMLFPGLPELTVSIGVACYPTCAVSVFALLDAADHALATAQREGRNRAAAAPMLAGQTPVRLAGCVGRTQHGIAGSVVDSSLPRWSTHQSVTDPSSAS